MNNVIENVKLLSRKMNLKRSLEDYKYYIVINNDKVEMILIKANKNLISKLGYFYNREDCQKVIDMYYDELICA